MSEERKAWKRWVLRYGLDYTEVRGDEGLLMFAIVSIV